MCAGRDVNDSVDGVEVGREGAVMLVGCEDQFCEALDGVGWVFGEEGLEGCDY